MDKNPVSKVLKPDLKVLSDVLARSFFDDPVSIYYFPSEVSRAKALNKFFYIHMAKLYFRFGHVYCNENKTGVAVWRPPGVKIDDLRSAVSLLPMATILRGRSILALRASARLEKKHPKYPPHFYLATLGVLPDCQGKGYGSELLKPILEHCDKELIPSYLESSKEKNLGFYQRHGFKLTGEVRLPKGPKVWLMWRDPQV